MPQLTQFDFGKKMPKEFLEFYDELFEMWNAGRFIVPPTTSAPVSGDTGEEGESRPHYLGSSRRLYYYINGDWAYIDLTNT